MPDASPADPAMSGPDAAALEFARTELGPASERLLCRPDAAAGVAARMASGRSLEDAVLAEVHGGIGGDRRVADEFCAYFLYDLMKMGSLSMSATSRLRRFLDTGDLVLSVFGDLWGGVADLRFESRQQFTALFNQRMGWKAIDQARRLSSRRRADDRRLPQRPEELELSAPEGESSPLPEAIRNEERERLILVLLRLSDRDRAVLTLHLQGHSIESIGEQLDLNYDAARQALKRAVERARRAAARSDARRVQGRIPDSR